MISHLQMITIYVSNLQDSLEFYTSKLGCIKTDEYQDDEQHLIWITPEGAKGIPQTTEIALFAPDKGDPRIGSASGLVFTSDDIEATYHELLKKGVTFSKHLVRHPYGEDGGDLEARFVDLDGNEFLLHS